ncbi:hypothetical protein [Micromonospora sp. NPDC049102]
MSASSERSDVDRGGDDRRWSVAERVAEAIRRAGCGRCGTST